MSSTSMSHADLILALDKQQQGENGKRCRIVEHGRLLPLPDGITLACCACGYRIAATLDTNE